MPIVQSYTSTDTVVTTTAETVAILVAGISTPSRDTRIDIRGEISLTMGTGSTQIGLQIKRGTTAAGTLVGEAVSATATPGATGTFVIEVSDIPGDVANQAYCLTVTQVGASGNGTIASASIEAEFPTG